MAAVSRRLAGLLLLVLFASSLLVAQAPRAARQTPRDVFRQMALDEDREEFLRHVSPEAQDQFAEAGLERWLTEPLVNPGEQHHVQVFAAGPVLVHWATPGVPERRIRITEDIAMGAGTVTLTWDRIDLRRAPDPGDDLSLRFDMKRHAGVWTITRMEASPDLLREMARLREGPAVPAKPAGPQTPREALLDMFLSKDKDSFMRHLPEVTRAKLTEMGMAEQVAGGPPLPVSSRALDGVKTFATGPVLVSVDLSKGEKFELSVLREEVKGVTAYLELGFHGYKQGKDRAAGVDPRLLIRMIQEAGVWKLADLGFSAHVPLDDPAFLDAVAKEVESSRVAANQSAARGALRSLVSAQAVYQMQFNRYTCSLAQLGGEGQGEPSEQHAQLIDSALESGKKSGFVFRLSRCDAAGKRYRASAVPEKPGAGPAYCTDDSGVIRQSDDGKALTCFLRGKPVD
jgi:hypothetical protein